MSLNIFWMNAHNFTNVHLVVKKKKYIRNKAGYLTSQGKKEF